MSNEPGYVILHYPRAKHVCPLPPPARDLAGYIAMCEECGQVSKCVDGDFWHWRLVSVWSERRWKKKAGIK